MTIPRDLSLKQVGEQLYVASRPSPELEKIQADPVSLRQVNVTQSLDLSGQVKDLSIPCRLDLSLDKAASFSVVLSNDAGEQVVIGFDQGQNQYYIDRTKSGKVDFHKEFARRHVSPRIAIGNGIDLTLVIDVSSVELFADDGLSVMSEIFFPNKPYNQIRIESTGGAQVKQLTYARILPTIK